MGIHNIYYSPSMRNDETEVKQSDYKPCSNCNGTGYVFDGSTTAVYARSICSWCNGTGQILDKIK